MALQSGDTSRAEALARSIIRTQPRHEGAHLLLARSLRSLGFNKQALQSCRTALQHLPRSVALLIEQALTQRAAGRHAEAEHSYRAVLEREPDNVSALHNLGNLLQARGQLDEAEALYKAVMAIAPQMALTHFEMGNVCATRQDTPGARRHWQAALLIQPSLAPAWLKLGADLQDDHPEAAIDALQKGLNIDASDATALALLSKLLSQVGRAVEAEQCAQMALQMAPHLPTGHYALGLARRVQGKLEAAIEPLYTTARLAQDQALRCEAIYLQALCHLDRGLISQATPLVQQLLTLSTTPQQSGMAHHVMGALLFDSGRIKEARAYFAQALSLHPGNLAHRVSYCATSLYGGDVDGPGQLTLSREHIGAIAGPGVMRTSVHADDTRHDKPGRIRLGLLSSDFRLHSCAFFLEPLLRHIDPARFELFAYDTGSRQDEFMQRFQRYIGHWRHVERLPSRELAHTVAQDRLHALVDLAGLTDGGRIEALAAKPAPVQITWLGYLGTTGHPAIDYRLTDEHVDGPDQQGLSTETPLKLERSYVCYQPPADAPDVAALPLLTHRHPTFGSFNALSKLSDACVDLWCDVLKALPGARLLLKTKALGDHEVCQQTLARFNERGVEPERIELLGWAHDIGSHLDIYKRIDIALDTTPYNGVTTTCESLWMGVPVVSLVGQTFSSRQGLSLLHAVALPELAAKSPADFVQRCVALVSQPEALASMRSSLRDRMANSPLTDGADFARAFERAIEQAIGGRA